MLRLPTRFGGMAIPHFHSMSGTERDASRAMTAAQVSEILQQNNTSWTKQAPERVRQDAMTAKRDFARQRGTASEAEFRQLRQSASADMSRRLEHLSSRGVSSWLNTLPIREHGYHLSKGDFRDAVALRYDWALVDVPTTCSCGQPFSPAHAMCCPTGGFPPFGTMKFAIFLPIYLLKFARMSLSSLSLLRFRERCFWQPQLSPPTMLALISGLEGCGPGHRMLSWMSGFFIPMLRPMPPNLSTNCWRSMRGRRSCSMLSASSMWTVGHLLH